MVIKNQEELNIFFNNFVIYDYLKKIICIDGEDGLGKTTKIAPTISRNINATIISADDYAPKDSIKYLKYFNYKKFENDVLRELKNGSVIIEGVLLLSILKKTTLSPYKFIHVISKTFFEELEVNKGKGLSVVIKEKEDEIKKIFKSKGNKYELTEFRKEMYKYYIEIKPLETADYTLIFE